VLCYFVSDVHLSSAQPGTVNAFLNFIARKAGKAAALYILGDLFDAWIGDDDDSELADAVGQELHKLASATSIYFMPGNRDFLVGQRFADKCGFEILPDEVIAKLEFADVLLTHGDLLCTDDHDYQEARKLLRNESFETDFLSNPIQKRIEIAADLRARSGEAISMKAEDIMDVNQNAVLSSMRAHGVRHLIHGHTHRPAHHRFTFEGETYHRYVLADWTDQGAKILALDASGIRFIPFNQL
jgi:UDP-2,3-diacylglucosamine hydrolase